MSTTNVTGEKSEKDKIKLSLSLHFSNDCSGPTIEAQKILQLWSFTCEISDQIMRHAMVGNPELMCTEV